MSSFKEFFPFKDSFSLMFTLTNSPVICVYGILLLILLAIFQGILMGFFGGGLGGGRVAIQNVTLKF